MLFNQQMEGIASLHRHSAAGQQVFAPLAVQMHSQHGARERQVLDDGVGMRVQQTELARGQVWLLACPYECYQACAEKHASNAAAGGMAGLEALPRQTQQTCEPHNHSTPPLLA